MKGKLIVIEGVDGSGKHTQAVNIQKRIGNAALVSFPKHNEDSGFLVDKYLSGVWEKSRVPLSTYVVSDMYAIDRAISYANDAWGGVYDNGGIVIADRYTQSNIIHQGAKILFKDNDIPRTRSDRVEEFKEYIRWLYEHEYSKLRIPCPDMVIFLYMNRETNEEIIRKRMAEDPSHADIHEKDGEYMELCRKTIEHLRTHSIASYYGKETVYRFVNESNEDGSLKPIDQITDEIMNKIIKGPM